MAKTDGKSSSLKSTNRGSRDTKKKATKQKKGNNIEDEYDGKTLHEHILFASDTYIGSVKPDEVQMFVHDTDSNKIVEEVIVYISGFFKIFDEILVNARDHSIRDKKCKHIKITIDKKSGEITVWNDGDGIPTGIHSKYNIPLPQMIFSQLLTSSNYKKKGKLVGGKNGFGSKVSNIYSKKFTVRTVGYDRIDDKTKAQKQEYKQVFENNMYKINKPTIKNVSNDTKSYTEISFLPDYEKFGMTGLTEDMYSLLVKRCYDVAACTSLQVKVTLNGKEIKCRAFKDYIKMYYDDSPRITHEKVNSRWEVGVAFDMNAGDRTISFVNGISTFQGGTHVSHVVTNVVQKVANYIKSHAKHKDLKIQPATIRQFLTFFINCVVEDPGFNSQTKEYMNSKVAEWCTCGKNCEDTRCNISDDFIEKLCKNKLMDEVVKMSEFKETREFSKSDGKKVGHLRDVEKLLDAKWAGKRNSHKTALFLTEGDSAKAFAVSGLAVIGNEKYGVFPLRGKLLNVRNAKPKQIKENKEFAFIKKILGLKQSMVYRDVSKLRYGGIVILTDQDPDGSHIKGLIINMLATFWPDLLQIPGFIRAYNTPIVKVWKKSDKKKQNVKSFYTITEFKNWVDKKMGGSMKGWEHKYYKGLGTSTEKEARDSFYSFDDNLVTFYWEDGDQEEMDEKETERIKSKLKKKMDAEKTKSKKQNNDSEESDDDQKIDEMSKDSEDPSDEIDYNYLNAKSYKTIVKVFDDKKTHDRKLWLKRFDRNDLMEYKPKMSISYCDFYNKDMIFFSNMDNDRSIPSMTDGLKPSQRMILYSCFKRGVNSKEVKVAQLSGYVSENTDYHHGEASLQGAIIGMAQNFPGSNNINLLKPNGTFGFRRQGGSDHASARYIFTEMDPITPTIYRKEDFEILDYNYDDSTRVEPVNYAPIIPMCLVNGAKGIGTGFSTGIPPYNPKDIVTNLKRIIKGKKPLPMLPWFNGFTGSIEQNLKQDDKFVVKGDYVINGNKINITEIPIVNGWLEPYEKYIKDNVAISKDDKKKIEDIDQNIGNNKIDMTLTFKGQELQKMYKDGSLDKFLKMTQSLSATNLHLFNAKGKMTKYDNALDIMKEFYDYRLEMYKKRKEFILKELQNDLDINKYKIKFIKEYLAKTLKIAGTTTEKVLKQLEDKKYPRMAHDHRATDGDKSYRYLTDMSILSLTTDKIADLEAKINECQMKYDKYLNTPIEDIWINELDELLIAYAKWQKEWTDQNEFNNVVKDSKKGKKKSKNQKVTDIEKKADKKKGKGGKKDKTTGTKVSSKSIKRKKAIKTKKSA